MYHIAEGQWLRKILFCTDFSENADFAFDFALGAASNHPDSTLFLFHVIPEPEAQFWKTYVYEVENVDEKARKDIDSRFSSYSARIPEPLKYECVVRIGKDYEEIIDFAREAEVDLIVMGRQGASALEKVFFGNVTEKVARKAPCPVLIIPMTFQKRVRPPAASDTAMPEEE